MINDVKFSEEIENIARIFFRNITCDVELLEIKFEFYSETGDFHLAIHAENKSKNIPVQISSSDVDKLYEYFSSIRERCIEKWYIAELKFYPDGTWNIEFVYGEIPEVEDEDEND